MKPPSLKVASKAPAIRKELRYINPISSAHSFPVVRPVSLLFHSVSPEEVPSGQ